MTSHVRMNHHPASRSSVLHSTTNSAHQTRRHPFARKHRKKQTTFSRTIMRLWRLCWRNLFIVERHERRKWSVLASLLPVRLLLPFVRFGGGFREGRVGDSRKWLQLNELRESLSVFRRVVTLIDVFRNARNIARFQTSLWLPLLHRFRWRCLWYDLIHVSNRFISATQKKTCFEILLEPSLVALPPSRFRLRVRCLVRFSCVETCPDSCPHCVQNNSQCTTLYIKFAQMHSVPKSINHSYNRYQIMSRECLIKFQDRIYRLGGCDRGKSQVGVRLLSGATRFCQTEYTFTHTFTF